MAIELTDDGTMDTVLRCSECGEEMRYNYGGDEDWRDVQIVRKGPGLPWRIVIDGEPSEETYTSDTAAQAAYDKQCYDEYVQECIEDAESEHECSSEPTEEEL